MRKEGYFVGPAGRSHDRDVGEMAKSGGPQEDMGFFVRDGQRQIKSDKKASAVGPAAIDDNRA